LFSAQQAVEALEGKLRTDARADAADGEDERDDQGIHGY
jgi:hypothetical protein